MTYYISKFNSLSVYVQKIDYCKLQYTYNIFYYVIIL